MIKDKPCKGINKAKGFQGCGKLTKHRKYGLCLSCYPTWLYSTDLGKLEIEKARIKGKKQVENKKKKEQSELKEKVRDFKKEFQDKINLLVRLIDSNQPCICTGKQHKVFHAGHFYSRGDCPELSYNLMNIYKQSLHSNNFKHADIHKYREGLERVYGKEHLEYVTDLKGKQEPLRLRENDYKELLKKVNSILREIKKTDLDFNAEERLKLRNEYNKRIGIYK